MKWPYLAVIITAVAVEIFVFSRLRVFGLEIPLLWLVCQFLLVSNWIPYHQIIIFIAIGGYLLDMLTSFKHGGEMAVLLFSSLIMVFLLLSIRKKYLKLPASFWVLLVSDMIYVLARIGLEQPPLSLFVIGQLAIYWVTILVVYYFFSFWVRIFIR